MDQRLKLGLAALLVVALAAVGGWALLRGGDGDASSSRPSAKGSESGSPSASASPAPTGTPSPTASASGAACEGPDTRFNEEGVEQESLLPDCGTRVVTAAQQKESGLDLGCGGTYPIILYKTTTTAGTKASVCGVDSSGEKFRVVVKPDGGEVVDLPGEYLPADDAFVGSGGGTRYEIVGRDGSIIVISGDSSRTETSDGDWISLDNESDYD